jgi:hypothetical protein
MGGPAMGGPAVGVLARLWTARRRQSFANEEFALRFPLIFQARRLKRPNVE